MLALIGALCILLRMLGVTLGTVDLGWLGLFFYGLHMAFGGYVPIPWHRAPRA